MSLDENIEVFIVYISSLSLKSKITIYLSKKAQIALLLAKKITVLAKYLDFANVFFKELTKMLLEYTKINEHIIKLVDGKQLFYRSIYSLELIELKILKTYIKSNLANNLICFSKFPAGTTILFVREFDSNLRLCVDY